MLFIAFGVQGLVVCAKCGYALFQTIDYVQLRQEPHDGVSVGFAIGAESDVGDALHARWVCWNDR